MEKFLLDVPSEFQKDDSIIKGKNFTFDKKIKTLKTQKVKKDVLWR